MDDLEASAALKTDPNVTYLRALPGLRIIVSGWSASGKTVYARYLAELLQCEYVCASSKLISELELADVNWIQDRDSLNEVRSREIDLRTDEYLAEKLIATPRIILDSWAAPFLGDVHDVAIWFECGLEVRTQNAMGPDHIAAENPEMFQAIREGLTKKDQDSIKLFRELYGFTYGPEPSIFPVTVDVTKILSPHRERWWQERHTVLFAMTSAIGSCLKRGLRGSERR